MREINERIDTGHKGLFTELCANAVSQGNYYEVFN